MGWLTSFLYSQLLIILPVPTHYFSNQTIVIIVSSTGFSLFAATYLTRLHTSLLILAVRSPSKGSSAKSHILSMTGHSPSSIEVWPLDMQSPSSISAFCERARKLRRLDAVIANAGIMTGRFTIVELGYKSTIGMNVVGTFLLVLGLLGKLREPAGEFGAKARIAAVASDLHLLARFPEAEREDIFAALNEERAADISMERDAVSKLIQVYAVRELGSKLASTSTASPREPVNRISIENRRGWLE